MKQLIIFSLTLLVLTSCEKRESIQPQTTSITESVYASGLVKSDKQYNVYSEASGIVDKRHVEIGDYVKKGDVIFTLRSTISELDKENARIALELTDENYKRIQSLEREVDLAYKQLQQDSLMYQRRKNLFNQKVGTEVELEQSKLKYESSRTAYKNLKTQLVQTQNQFVKEKERAKNNLKITKERESNFTVRSAISGKVFSLEIEQGEMIHPQTVLAVIGQDTGYVIEVQVDENDIVKVKPGQEMFVVLESYKDQVFKAEVTKIHPGMNQRSGTFTVEGKFIQTPPKLFPNLNLESNILIRKKGNVLVIPREYLIDDKYVLINENEKKEVKTGLKNYQYVEIISGIAKEDIIYKP